MPCSRCIVVVLGDGDALDAFNAFDALGDGDAFDAFDALDAVDALDAFGNGDAPNALEPFGVKSAVICSSDGGYILLNGIKRVILCNVMPITTSKSYSSFTGWSNSAKTSLSWSTFDGGISTYFAPARLG